MSATYGQQLQQSCRMTRAWKTLCGRCALIKIQHQTSSPLAQRYHTHLAVWVELQISWLFASPHNSCCCRFCWPGTAAAARERLKRVPLAVRYACIKPCICASALAQRQRLAPCPAFLPPHDDTRACSSCCSLESRPLNHQRPTPPTFRMALYPSLLFGRDLVEL